jgi:predicted nucleotidyltransferase
MVVTQAHIDYLIELAHEYNARKLILFGSALRTPENARDIDLAADIDGTALYEFAGMAENVFDCTVDIVSLADNTPFTRHILQYGKVLL